MSPVLPASKETPFVNSLGIPFVPVPRFSTLFATWLVRFQDYQKYIAEKNITIPDQATSSAPDHPVVNITWPEAVAFCDWLTEKERALGIIPANLSYRLPGDMEWSAAVGLPNEQGNKPDDRSGKVDGYPWGLQWPPPQNAGNYSQELGVDPFEFTSPVATFAANEFGIYDLGGNVWEWCHDFYDRSHETRVLRGASWFNGYQDRLKSSFRNDLGTPDSRYTSFGFRLTLGEAH